MTGVKRTFSRSAARPTRRYKRTRTASRTRPRTMKRKRTSTKKRAKSVKRTRRTGLPRTTPKEIKKHLTGFLNPFANTGGAKIPDGSSLLSMPIQHRIVQEIASGVTVPAAASREVNFDSKDGDVLDGTTSATVAAAASRQVNFNSKDGDIHILMYPGLQSGLIWAENPAASIDEAPVYYTFTVDSTLDGEFSLTSGSDVLPSQGPSLARLRHQGGISKWRNVSQALRLSLLNTDQENDGWWESCRVAYKPRMEDWKVFWPNGASRTYVDNNGDNTVRSKATIYGGSFVADDSLIDNLEFRNIAEQKGYKAGSLKDIHKMQWDLCPQTGDHAFINTEEYYNFKTFWEGFDSSNFEAQQDALCDTELLMIGGSPNGTTPNYQGAVNLKGSSGSTAFKTLFEDMTDFNQDMIFIRIHPGSQGVRLLAELAVNKEVVYDLDSVLSKHHTPNDSIHAAAFVKTKEFKMEQNQYSANARPMDVFSTS